MADTYARLNDRVKVKLYDNGDGTYSFTPPQSGSDDYIKKEIDAAEISLTNRFLIGGPITDLGEQQHWKELIEEKSFGQNTVLFDDVGNPSVMVIRMLVKESDLLEDGRDYPHPAFIINGTIVPRLYISKYDNIIVGEGSDARAVSIKGVDPQAHTPLNDAITACKQKGVGWHVMTNAEYSMLALQCLKRGFTPRGNNVFGKNYFSHDEKGIPSHFYLRNGEYSAGRVLTGSGPITWTDDGTPFGVYDIQGNVTNHATGLRIVGGEIQIFENNNAADNSKDFSESSSEWKAIMPDGSLVVPGTEGTLKYDFETAALNKIIINTTINYRNTTEVNRNFASVVAASGVTIPKIAKLLGIAPISGLTPTNQGSIFLVNTEGEEKTARRGGGFMDGYHTGITFLAVNAPRTVSTYNIGFRSAFVKI